MPREGETAPTAPARSANSKTLSRYTLQVGEGGLTEYKGRFHSVGGLLLTRVSSVYESEHLSHLPRPLVSSAHLDVTLRRRWVCESDSARRALVSQLSAKLRDVVMPEATGRKSKTAGAIARGVAIEASLRDTTDPNGHVWMSSDSDPQASKVEKKEVNKLLAQAEKVGWTPELRSKRGSYHNRIRVILNGMAVSGGHAHLAVLRLSLSAACARARALSLSRQVNRAKYTSLPS